MVTDQLIYKITPRIAWEQAVAKGRFDGAPIDIQDGFIHFSTAGQVAETAAKHFSGQTDLLLVAVEPRSLADTLKWEKSRGDALFPHLYSSLQIEAVVWSRPMPMQNDGNHSIPLDIA
jgi:uncharacterized protein (DUF952 family)